MIAASDRFGRSPTRAAVMSSRPGRSAGRRRRGGRRRGGLRAARGAATSRLSSSLGGVPKVSRTRVSRPVVAVGDRIGQRDFRLATIPPAPAPGCARQRWPPRSDWSALPRPRPCASRVSQATIGYPSPRRGRGRALMSIQLPAGTPSGMISSAACSGSRSRPVIEIVSASLPVKPTGSSKGEASGGGAPPPGVQAESARSAEEAA